MEKNNDKVKMYLNKISKYSTKLQIYLYQNIAGVKYNRDIRYRPTTLRPL